MNGETKVVWDCFREIGINTSMWPDRCEETIFFIQPRYENEEECSAVCRRRLRMDNATPEAVEEFIAYWENQLSLARDYVKNGCNPNIHEWSK